MPGFDGTGPDFAGPMTGGARGYCANDRPVSGMAYGYGDGRGYGFGRGRRCRLGPGQGARMPMGVGRMRNFHDPNPAVLMQLEQQAAAMQRSLEALNRRIASLKADLAASAPPATGGED